MINDLDPNQVEDAFFINDVREEFPCITFSKFKKTQVKTELFENLNKGKIEQSCYWCAELICSGHLLDIWEIIFTHYGKYIHLANPKMATYLCNRYGIFKNIINQSIFTNILQLRNNEKIRKLFAEIIVVVVISNKKHSIEPVKINRVEEFDITQMTERLKAPGVQYAELFFQPKDPKELYIAINEFSHAISNDYKNTLVACYWIEWIIEFESICKSRKQPCRCVRRTDYDVDNKYQMDIIWIIWDAILFYGKIKEDGWIMNIMNSLVSLFCIKYTNTTSKKRRYLLYMAVALLTEHVHRDIEIVRDKNIVKTVTENIGFVYKDIKKNEESPKMDYLFSGLQQEKHKNISESLRKMELMNTFMATEIKTPTDLVRLTADELRG
jgi:hypothetical protein